jgi:chitinase
MTSFFFFDSLSPTTGYTQVGPGTDIYPYKVLPLSGAQVFENTADVASFSYDARRRQLVSYDTPHIAGLKAKYVQANGLAGSMFWEVCRPPGPGPISRRGSALNILVC